LLYSLLTSADRKEKRPRAAQTAGGMAQEGLAPMHDKPIGAGDDRAVTTAAEDTRDQAAVLRHALDLHPETRRSMS